MKLAIIHNCFSNRLSHYAKWEDPEFADCLHIWSCITFPIRCNSQLLSLSCILSPSSFSSFTSQFVAANKISASSWMVSLFSRILLYNLGQIQDKEGLAQCTEVFPHTWYIPSLQGQTWCVYQPMYSLGKYLDPLPSQILDCSLQE